MNPGDEIQGTLGFAVLGIEIYLPLSSHLTLGCFCPSIRRLFEATDSRLQLWGLSQIARAFRGSSTLEIAPGNVNTTAFRRNVPDRFVERSTSPPTDSLARICRRLENNISDDAPVSSMPESVPHSTWFLQEESVVLPYTAPSPHSWAISCSVAIPPDTYNRPKKKARRKAGQFRRVSSPRES